VCGRLVNDDGQLFGFTGCNLILASKLLMANFVEARAIQKDVIPIDRLNSLLTRIPDSESGRASRRNFLLGPKRDLSPSQDVPYSK